MNHHNWVCIPGSDIHPITPISCFERSFLFQFDYQYKFQGSLIKQYQNFMYVFLLKHLLIYIQNVGRNCSLDADFQSSTDSLSGYWIIPEDLKLFTPDMYFAIEHKSLYGGMTKKTLIN